MPQNNGSWGNKFTLILMGKEVDESKIFDDSYFLKEDGKWTIQVTRCVRSLWEALNSAINDTVKIGLTVDLITLLPKDF